MDFALKPLRVSLRQVKFRYVAGETDTTEETTNPLEKKPGTLGETTLEIPPGQCVVLTGPSGGGKTTLVRIL